MQKENIFQVMFKHATIGILIVKSDGIITTANPFAEKLLGYNCGELEGQSVDVLVPNALRGGHAHHRKKYHKKPVERVMGAGIDLYAKRKNGATFPVEISLGHAELDGEKIAIAYINNIATRKKSEAYNKDISKIVEESLNEIFIFDAKSLKFISVNEGGRQNVGYTMEELRELTPLSIKPEYTKKSFLKLIAPLINREKGKIKFETIHQRKDKTTYPVEIHLQYASLGRQAVFVAIILDITERRKAENLIEESRLKLENYAVELELKVKERTDELEKSQLKLTEAQSIAKIGHWDWWIQESKLVFSEGMYQIFDLAEGTVITGEQMESFIHPNDREMVREEITKSLTLGKGYSIDHRIITAGGNLKFVHSNVQIPIFDEKGELFKIFGVLKDITSQKESEKQLEEALNKEKELGVLKSRFVSMASHEFRTPLSSILSSAELLGMYIEARKFDKTDKNINRIKNSVRNLTGILNDFLSLEKLEAGKVEVQTTTINLAEYLEELSEEIKPILRPNQKLLLETHQQTAIETDPYLLKNILINLISNAIKYSPKGQDVTLEIIKAKKQLIFKIIDRGIGIPPEDKQHMFTRFFRASNVETIKGTGLGLTIVKRYLDLVGGDMGFESKYGKGSTFFFNLPRNEDS